MADTDRVTREVSTTGRTRHWSSLDVLRAIALLLVLCRHHTGIAYLHQVGWIGVDLFFVLSGFLVSGLVFDEVRRTGSFRAWRFLVRRGFKIYPSFYLLFVVSALHMWYAGWGKTWTDHLAEVFFFQNYHEGLWPHTWSLAVEEHFYFLLVAATAAILAFHLRLTWWRLVGICVLVFITCLALRCMTATQEHIDPRAHLFPTHLRMDSMLAGVLLAAWIRYRPKGFHAFFQGSRWMLMAALVLFLLPALLNDLGSQAVTTYGFSGVWLAASIAVGMAVASDAGREEAVQAPLWRGLAWIGTISYTTYLWHMFVLTVQNGVFNRTGWSFGVLDLPLYAACSILVGWCASVVVERPFLRLRERLAPRQ